MWHQGLQFVTIVALLFQMRSTAATPCVPGEFNGHAPLQVEANDIGLTILTTSGVLLAMGSTVAPPSGVASILLSNRRAYAAVMRAGDGSDAIFTWGDPAYGGDGSDKTTTTLGMLNGKNTVVIALRATESGFAALLSTPLPIDVVGDDGATPPQRQQRVVSWGDRGGSLPPPLTKAQVDELHSTTTGFAAVLPSGDVVTWGHCDTGGETPPLMGVPEAHRPLTALAWADAYCAGELLAASQLVALGGAATICPAWAPPLQDPAAAMAVTPHGDFWGWAIDSALSPPTSIIQLRYRSGLAAASSRAFATITEAGGVTAWGEASKGGEISASLSEQVSTRAAYIYSTLAAFAVLTIDGGVSIWGDGTQGGGFYMDRGVTGVASTDTAFALLFDNATVLVVGGDTLLKRTWWLDGVLKLEAGRDTFIAHREQGAVVSWGRMEGNIPPHCQKCREGTWSHVGATQCTQCSEGYWSEEGASHCQPCTFGICQRYVVGGILGFVALLFVFCAVCLCDVAQEEAY